MNNGDNQNLCPHCGTTLPVNKAEQNLGYGQMLKVCGACKQVFLDQRIKEAAVFGVDKGDKRIIRSYVYFVLVVGVVITASLIVELLWGRRLHYIAFLGPIALLYGIFSFVKELLTYRKRKRLLQEEENRSRQRLSDPNYCMMLMNAGINVPEIYTAFLRK